MTRPPYVKLVENVTIPRVALVRQTFPAEELASPAETLRQMWASAPEVAAIKPGMRIAVTVGSRGLASLVELVRTLVELVRERGAEPFAVPAMGSHGGATAEGQVELLRHLGVTGESIGCPIRSSMDTVELGVLDNGMSVRIDRLAHEADGILLFNRIKPHTAFRAPNESGLVKMLAIGLGKQSGADNCHAWGFGYMGRFIVETARVKLAKCKILFGVGTIENAYDKVSKLVFVPPGELIEKEREYLAEAMRNLPRLPLGPVDGPLASGPLDVLVVDAVGKEFSGAGMDTNLTGRPFTRAISGGPDISRLAVLDVTDKSQGNATGIAAADVVTQRLIDKFDRVSVYTNSLTSGLLKAAGLPMAMPDDRSVIKAAVKTCMSHTPDAISLLRIPNTLHVGYLYASECMLPELARRPGVSVLTEPADMRFDAEGGLLDPWPDHE